MTPVSIPGTRLLIRIGLICLVVPAVCVAAAFVILEVASSRVERASQARCDEIVTLNREVISSLSEELASEGATVRQVCSSDGAFLIVSASVGADRLPLEVWGHRYSEDDYVNGRGRCVEDDAAPAATLQFGRSGQSVNVSAEFVRGLARCT